MANVVVRLTRELEAAAGAEPRDSARYAAVLERVTQTYLIDPDVQEAFDLAALYYELALEYAALDRCDDALEAAEAAFDAGLVTGSDPRCLRAQILMQGGRFAEAEPLWAAARAATPEDVWLYFHAGVEYGDAGRYAAALDWLTDGLRLALRTGDPDGLVGELADMRWLCMDQLGQPVDTLLQQAAAFLASQDPDDEDDEPEPEPEQHGPLPVALAWFPAGEYETATGLWPELGEEGAAAGPNGPLAHPQYCRALQQQLVDYARAGTPTLAVAPLAVAPFTAWCAERGQQPETAEARAGYAAHLGQGGEAIPWPPGRNDGCWCGSGRKYKKCCAAP